MKSLSSWKAEISNLLELPTGALNRRAQRFMDGVSTPKSLIHRFEPYKELDASMAAKSFLEGLGAELTYFVGDSSDLLDNLKLHTERDIASLLIERIELDNDEIGYGLGSGLAFVRYQGRPMIVHCWLDNGYHLKVVSGSDAENERFIQEFVEYEQENCVLTSKLRSRVERSLNKRVITHMRGLEKPEVVNRSYPAYQIPNISLMAVDFFKELGGEFLGFQSRDYGKVEPLDFLEEAVLEYGGHFKGIDVINPTYKKYEIAIDDVRKGLSRGIILFELDEIPMIAMCYETDRFDKEYVVSVVSSSVPAATAVLDRLDQFEKEHSIYRGHILRPKFDRGYAAPDAEILRLSPVDWDDVILPEKMKRTIKTQVIEFSHYLDALSSLDLDVKRGLLFHGPPGTGKTLICRLLASRLKGFTTIVASGTSLLMPVEIFKLARKLSPALVVFEDVDLMGAKREENAAAMILGDLLNELDGIQKSETIFTILTTNHLEYIEEALVQRPGRIDIVLEFPLPGPELRLRLMHLYSGATKLSLDAPSVIIERTDGATPAFLREMMKQSVFGALRENAAAGDLEIRDEHIIATLDSLKDMEKNGRTREIIGFGKGR